MSTEFPKRLPEKLKAIREQYDHSLTELLKPFDAQTIAAYETGASDLPLSVLFAYAKAAGIPVENLINDDRDVWFGHRMN